MVGDRIAGQFRLERFLKEGLGVSTWLGSDQKTGQPVVVRKSAPDAGTWLRLAHEAEVLGELELERIPRLLHLGREEGEILLVAEFLSGRTLEEELGSRQLDWQEAVQRACSLLEVLAQVHERGILHRDLKPSNLICRPEQHLAVIDWGLSRSWRLHTAFRDVTVGTVQYMAPEMAGTVARDVAEPADLYSVGVILYECLTGRLLYPVRSISELLRRQLLSDSIPALGGSVPGTLRPVLTRLLQKEPADRYASASEVRQDLQHVLQGRSVHPTRPLSRRVRPPLIGRQREREELRQGRQALLLGPAGSGKSTLLEEYCREALAQGAWVLRGQALSRSETEPLQLLSGVFYELSQRCGPELGQALGPHRAVLAHIAPDLRPLLGEDQPDRGPEDLGPRRVQLALDHLLGQLGTPERPAVLVLDDIHWADGLSRNFCEQLLRAGAPENIRVVLSGRPPLDLKVGTETRIVELAPLDREEASQLLTAMGVGPDDARQQWLLDFGEGNPLLLVEGTQGVEAGDKELLVSPRGAHLLSRRLGTLPPEARHVLRRAAVLGRSFNLATVAAMLEEDPRPGLELARASRVIWQKPSGSEYAFAHDRLREQILDELLPTQRLELHALAARALAQTAPSSVAALAFHLSEAGDKKGAAGYARQAAEAARERYEFAQAAQGYRMVLEVEPESLPVMESLADVLYWSNQNEEAKRYYLQALDRAGLALDRCRLRLKLGRAIYGEGDLEVPLELGRAALRDLGSSGREHIVLSMQALLLVAESQLNSGKPFSIELLGLVLRLWWIAVRNPKWPDSMFLRASVCSLLGHFPRTNFLSLGMAPRLVEEQAQLDLEPIFRGRILSRSLTGPLFRLPAREALPGMQTAFEALFRAGDLWEFTMAAWVASIIRVNIGEFEFLKRQGAELYRIAEASDHTWGKVMAATIWALGTGGRVPESIFAWLSDLEPLTGFAEMHRRQGLSLCLIGRDRPAEALSLLYTTTLVPMESYLLKNLRLTALRRAAELTQIPWQRREFILQHRRLARVLEKAGLPAAQAAAWREAALAAAARGHRYRAERLFQRSLDVSVDKEYCYQEALTFYERELFRQRLKLPAFPEAALERLLAMGATWHGPGAASPAPALSLVDRFEQCLDWGRQLVASPSESTVYSNLCRAAQALLRCQSVAVVRLPGLERLAGSPFPLSEAAIQRSLRGQTSSGEDPALRDSLLVRQPEALITPIEVFDQTPACLYALEAERGEEEVLLARFLSTLAGATRENLAVRQRFHDLFQAVAEPLLVLNSEARILEANNRFREVFGQVPPSFTDLIHPADNRSFVWTDGGEVRLETAQGTTVWAQVLPSRSGSLYIVGITNITHHRLEQLARLQEDERRLVSSEIHDVLAGTIASLNFLLQQREGGPDLLLRCRAVSGQLLQDLSRCIHSLRVPVLSQSVLGDLRAFVEQLRSEGAMEVTADLAESLQAPPLALTFAGRILREALTNARRHSRAHHVHIRLQSDGERLRGEIADDGVGFEPSRVGGFRSGLASMRFRVDLLGGMFSLESKPGAGTRVAFEIPTGEGGTSQE